MRYDLQRLLDKLEWMEDRRIWPNGLRYLWTDAFGVVLLVSLYERTGERRFLEEAEWVVAEVDRVLGRERGYRIGQAPDRDGQYFHYLAMWMYALWRLGRLLPAYHEKAVALAREIHRPFVVPDTGVIWKMEEDLGAPYPGHGFGGLDPFHGYVVYRLLDEDGLAGEIEDMRRLVDQAWPRLTITQDLGLGMMLWTTHHFPDETWAQVHRERSLAMLERLWREPPGYFCRQPGMGQVRYAFTNYGIGIGLQAVGVWPERVDRLHDGFESYRSGDRYDVEAITHVMGCCSHFPGELIRPERGVCEEGPRASPYTEARV